MDVGLNRGGMVTPGAKHVTEIALSPLTTPFKLNRIAITRNISKRIASFANGTFILVGVRLRHLVTSAEPVIEVSTAALLVDD